MDRALDKQIAEQVMGWVDFWEGRDEFREYLMGYPPNEQAMGIEAERAPVPHYSTEISAAWEVVEEMNRRGLEVAVIQTPFFIECHVEPDDSRWTEIQQADAAPHAICLAALQAVKEIR